VVAPDTYRGDSSTFIPKCIWLALSTPQERVNDDLDDVLLHLEISPNNKKLAVMGFCYGGGKALRYTIDRQNDAATVVCYGSPVTDVTQLQKLNKPLCGVFGGSDAQFPAPLLAKFRTALTEAQVENNVRIYDGVGHAFWKDMEQIEKGDQPQLEAYQQVTSFLKEQFRRGGAKSRREPTC
jgi:carboxymethylenebutenolidase